MTTQRETKRRKAVYVYGIIPGDVELRAATEGVGEPPSEVRLLRHQDLAALVSDVDVHQQEQLGRPEDLMAHEGLLDSCSADVPVLPLRFGSIVTDDDAVTNELLGEHYDEFLDALDELEGRAEYVVKGRYVEDVILREVLAENDEAAQLSERIRDTGEDATRDVRIRLGEIVGGAIAGKRERDTALVTDAMKGHAAATVVREPTHELDAVYAAFLVETGEAAEVEKAVEKLAHDWDGRVELRLLGPLAAYDFAGTASAAPEG
jgi:Gas vesicle synthesis protein GvpL/GvpF